MNTRRTNNERAKLVGVMLLGLLVSIMTVDAKASTAPASFTYQGKIFNANGTRPLQSGSVTFKLQLRSPDGQCLLFEETHIRNMTGTGGVFSLNVGEGSNTGRTNLSLLQVIDNSTNKTGDASCSYHPVAGDTRRIRLIYDDGSGDVTFPTDQTLRSVPYAMNASTLQGLSKDKSIQTSAQVTQTRLEQIFGSFQVLIDLIQGNSTAYVKSSDLPVSGGVLNLSSGGVKVPNTPASNDSAVNRNYVDARVAGSTVDLTGLGNGQTMIWNSTQNKWTVGYSTLPATGTAGTYTKVTTDAQGRVISGAPLAASDIPAHAGDVTGTFASSVVQRIQGVNVSSTAPINGQVLTYNSSNSRWEATTPTAGTVTSVSATAPLAIQTASTTPTVSIQAGSGSGQSLVWSGSASSVAYPNVSQLRGVANNAQFPTNCAASQTLVYVSPMDRYECADISIASSKVTGLGTAATMNVGTTAGTVAAGNNSRIVNALTASTTAGGDVSGSFSALSVNKIRGVDVSSTAPTNGQVLKYDSTSSSFVFSADNNSGGTVTSLTPGTGSQQTLRSRTRERSISTSVRVLTRSFNWIRTVSSRLLMQARSQTCLRPRRLHSRTLLFSRAVRLGRTRRARNECSFKFGVAAVVDTQQVSSMLRVSLRSTFRLVARVRPELSVATVVTAATLGLVRRARLRLRAAPVVLRWPQELRLVAERSLVRSRLLVDAELLVRRP